MKFFERDREAMRRARRAIPYPNDRKKRREYRAFLFEAQGGNCYWCKAPMTLAPPVQGVRMADNYASFEHLTPVSQGGSRHSANIVLSCYWCNLKRGTTHPLLM